MAKSSTIVVQGRGSFDAVCREDEPSVGDALDRIVDLGFDWNGAENIQILQDGVEIERASVYDAPLTDGGNVVVLSRKPAGARR